MKYWEMKEDLEAMGYEVEKVPNLKPESQEAIRISNGDLLAVRIGPKGEDTVDNWYSGFMKLSPQDKGDLMDVVYEYMRGRWQAEKYIYRLNATVTGKFGKNHYIARNRIGMGLKFDSSPPEFVMEDEAFHFTDEEVAQYSDEERGLFLACEKVKVDEE